MWARVDQLLGPWGWETSHLKNEGILISWGHINPYGLGLIFPSPMEISWEFTNLIDPWRHHNTVVVSFCLKLKYVETSIQTLTESWVKKRYISKKSLVGGWTNPFEKYARQIGSNWIISPRFGVKIKHIWNHPDQGRWWTFSWAWLTSNVESTEIKCITRKILLPPCFFQRQAFKPIGFSLVARFVFGNKTL